MIKKIVIYSIIFFLVTSLVFFVIAAFVQKRINEDKTSHAIDSEAMLIQAEKSIISGEISKIVNDLEFSAQILLEYGFKDGNLDIVKNIWVDFSDKKQAYDQIRYIDAQGLEQIRINNNKGEVELVEPKDLQDKSDRYYFIDTMALQKGQIYISRFDLNIENGELELPIKPMIRIATPVFDKSGQSIGMVILNYCARGLLENFTKIAGTRHGDIFLLNEDGYWISKSDDESYEWAFMYEDKQDIKFSKFYPKEWEEVAANQKGTIKSDNGDFIYTEIIPMDDDTGSFILGEGNWTVMSYISPEVIKEEQFYTTFEENLIYVIRTQPFGFLAILIISVLVSMLLVLGKQSRDRIRYFSEYDTMTKVYNRRAGLEILAKLYKEAHKKKENLSVCFIDINGLKQVNDNLGHDMGDELLITVADCIRLSSRKSDYFARLGGDEFLLILPGSDKNTAETVWQRAKTAIDEVNNTQDRAYTVSVSHGIAQFEFSANEHIDDILNIADKRMYVEKKRIKKDLQVLKKA